jgi:hypothetical protein
MTNVPQHRMSGPGSPVTVSLPMDRKQWGEICTDLTGRLASTSFDVVGHQVMVSNRLLWITGVLDVGDHVQVMLSAAPPVTH